MRVVRLTKVDQRKHHEDERLQRDHQNVEQRPDGASDNVAHRQQHTRQRQGRSTTHEGDEHEHQFASLHVAEQPHAMGHGVGYRFS